jgi:putative ABC transport system permease protein
MNTRYVVTSVVRRPLDTVVAALAIALSVAFLGSLGSFASATGDRLTQRASGRVPVDWQVQLGPGADVAAVSRAVAGVPGLVGSRPVDYAKVAGLSATSPAGTRTTGTSYVVSLPADYPAFAPSELRTLVGSTTGAVLQQQTASNLAARPGTVVTVVGTGKSVRTSGVVDLPNADSFFQVVGATGAATSSAAPDNVLLVPPAVFATLVPQADVVHQLHVRLDHESLPGDPAAAADEVRARANHLVSAVAGTALVGDNLEAALSGAREDALYARLLVLLLGAPGLVLSAVVTGLVLSLRNDRQRRDLGLLRLRGATPRLAASLLGATAVVDGVLGGVLGTLGALVAARAALGSGSTLSTGWVLGAALAGLVLAVAVELAPVAGLLRNSSPSVRSQVDAPGSVMTPLALRLGLDVVLLAASAVVFWLTSRGGYQVVVVPEGVPVASVNYAALLAPALAWPGLALLVWRLTALAVDHRGRTPSTDAAGRLQDLRHEVVRRRRRLVARGATGLAVALAVTTSAAVFTTTYDQQARVDVALTVGSDVAVTLPPDATTSLDPTIAQRPGVLAVEQVAHRLAYVGPDLQDVYGIDPTTIGRAAPLQDAFTPGSSVTAALAALARTPDGVLLSQETLHDYQLRAGDQVRLRLRDRTGAYVAHTFHVVGVVTEFATAPRDSFILANRGYLAAATGVSAVQTLLVRTDHPATVAASIQAPPTALVNDITAPRVAVPSASGLAAGSLAGLARLILAFGLLLAVTSAALVLAVGASQRRRSLVALAVLGATARQRAGFLWTEARWIVLSGVLGGLVAGTVVAFQLVKVLNGIFDPPPQVPAVPAVFLAVLLAAVVGGAVLATAASARWAGRVDASRLREL